MPVHNGIGYNVFQQFHAINRPNDIVSGYTIKQLESSLYGATTWTKWRDIIKKQHTNVTSGNVDELFSNWN